MLEYLLFSFVIPLAIFAKTSKTDFNGYVGYKIQLLDCRNKDTDLTRYSFFDKLKEKRGNAEYEKQVKKQKKEAEKRNKEKNNLY